MDGQREHSSENEREERIRERAHGLWEQDGRPDDKDKEHWDRAASELDGGSQAPPSSKMNGGLP